VSPMASLYSVDVKCAVETTNSYTSYSASNAGFTKALLFNKT